uniref:HTH OST-type domain-containing protein n=1 Tax=Timema poppense TaxID=170557 RepID=A0A7R9CNM0_TIMPO|nr:unnamed protein product [Timema poppensis]
MPGKCLFKAFWQTTEENKYSKGLRPLEDDLYKAYCTFCKSTFDISHNGVKIRGIGKKHLELTSVLLQGWRRVVLFLETEEAILECGRNPSSHSSHYPLYVFVYTYSSVLKNERETVTGAAPAINNCEEVTPDPAISYVDFVSVDKDVAVCGEVIDSDIIAKFSTITSRLRMEHLVMKRTIILHSRSKLLLSLQVVPTQSGLMITLVNQSQDHQLGLQTRRILMGQPDFKMAAPDFLQAFWRLYKKAFDLRKAEDELADIIKVDNSGLVMTFELKPLQKFACNVYRLLYECKGSIPLVSFDFMYLRLFAIPCQPALLGYPSLEALLRAIPETVLLRGGIRDQRMLILNKDLADVTSDSNRQTYKNSAELLIRNLANGSSHFQTIGEPELDTPAKALRCDSDAPLNQFKLWSPPSFSYYNQACMPPQVNLPPCPPAPPLSSTVDLLSPEKTLLSAHTLPHVVPPHPSELPLPELPSKKSCNSMDSSFGSNEPGSPSQMRREYQPHLY